MKKRGKKCEMVKKSQVTVFVIIAIAIVAILLIIFLPNIKKLVIPAKPIDLIPRECMIESVQENLDKVMLHGGNENPELYFNYNNVSLNYLCYTPEWYKTCVMQIPLLKQELESIILKNSRAKIANCVSNMERELKKKYDVKSSGLKNIQIKIEPKKIVIVPEIEMTLEKADVTQKIELRDFKTSFDSNSYDMIMIASSIQNFEARFGDSSIDTYMSFYPSLKVEKIKQDDGTKVYIITDRNTKEKLMFATRSLAWPPGFAIPLQFAES
jgi:competence protein ComGC